MVQTLLSSASLKRLAQSQPTLALLLHAAKVRLLVRKACKEQLERLSHPPLPAIPTNFHSHTGTLGPGSQALACQSAVLLIQMPFHAYADITPPS